MANSPSHIPFSPINSPTTCSPATTISTSSNTHKKQQCPHHHQLQNLCCSALRKSRSRQLNKLPSNSNLIPPIINSSSTTNHHGLAEQATPEYGAFRPLDAAHSESIIASMMESQPQIPKQLLRSMLPMCKSPSGCGFD